MASGSASCGRLKTILRLADGLGVPPGTLLDDPGDGDGDGDGDRW